MRTVVLLFCMAGGAIASPADALLAAVVDCRSRPELERTFLKYGIVEHLPTGQDRMEIWQAISGHVNGTSRKSAINRPVVILAPLKQGGPLEEVDGLVIRKEDWDRAILIRINILYYGYDRATIEKLELVEPHFHFREKKTQTVIVNVPIVPVVVDSIPADELVYVQREGGLLKQVKRSEVWIEEDSWRQGEGRTLIRLPWKQREQKAIQQEQKAENKVNKLVAPGAEKAIADLALMTNSNSPIFLADWFWWQTSIQAERAPGPGYADLLGFKDQDSFHIRVGFDSKLFRVKFTEFVREYLEAVGRSGVSRQPRRISVETKLGGEIWITFDNKVAKGDRNPLEIPDKTFKFDATEQLAHLPNGILAMGLFDAQGKLQESAPDFIGPDKTSTGNDGRIHLGQCFRCHSEGLKPFDGWYKNLYRPGLKVVGPEYQAIIDLQDKYYGRILTQLKPGVDRHAIAIREATGLTLEDYSKVIGKRWKIVQDDEVDMGRAAREFGVTKDRLQAAFRAYKAEHPGKPLVPQGVSVLDMFLRDEKERQTIPVDQFWDSITEGYKILAAYRP